jgi:hypothetical protein
VPLERELADFFLVLVGTALARRCIVARRKEELENVKQRCLELMLTEDAGADQRKEDTILVVAGDISNVDDMMTIRRTVLDGACAATEKCAPSVVLTPQSHSPFSPPTTQPGPG